MIIVLLISLLVDISLIIIDWSTNNDFFFFFLSRNLRILLLEITSIKFLQSTVKNFYSTKHKALQNHIYMLWGYKVYKQKLLQSITIYDYNLSLTHVEIQLKNRFTPSRLDLRYG